MSPWKPRADPDDDNVNVEDAEDVDDEQKLEKAGADEQEYSAHHGAAWGGHEEPELQAFAKRLPNSCVKT